jgi:hypothetical protein
MIFKQASFEEELFEGMQSAQLKLAEEEANSKPSLIINAMQQLDAAAKECEMSSKPSLAREVTGIMVSLASGRKSKKETSKEKKSKEKKDVSEVLKFFGFEAKDLKEKK